VEEDESDSDSSEHFASPPRTPSPIYSVVSNTTIITPSRPRAITPAQEIISKPESFSFFDWDRASLPPSSLRIPSFELISARQQVRFLKEGLLCRCNLSEPLLRITPSDYDRLETILPGLYLRTPVQGAHLLTPCSHV